MAGRSPAAMASNPISLFNEEIPVQLSAGIEPRQPLSLFCERLSLGCQRRWTGTVPDDLGQKFIRQLIEEGFTFQTPAGAHLEALRKEIDHFSQ
jgi:hypothetical protein